MNQQTTSPPQKKNRPRCLHKVIHILHAQDVFWPTCIISIHHITYTCFETCGQVETGSQGLNFILVNKRPTSPLMLAVASTLASNNVQKHIKYDPLNYLLFYGLCLGVCYDIPYSTKFSWVFNFANFANCQLLRKYFNKNF